MTQPATLRKNGYVFAAAFAVLALLARNVPALAVALLAVAGATLAVAIARPSLLEKPNRAWMRLGEAMHKVVNPVVLGVLYVLLIVPTGLLRRFFAGDPLHRRPDPALDSYWVESEERAHSLDTFRRPY